MTKMIVITGLDGSGKSTFHHKLETEFGSQSATLRLPAMDSQKFQDDPVLFDCCRLINELGERGDKEAEPGMKIIALFSSVVLFNDLFNFLRKRNVAVIFCERHPLIDTYIYAQAYLKVMNPANLSIETAKGMDVRYDLLLTEVTRRLKVDITGAIPSNSRAFLSFLYAWFSKSANLNPENLFQLFIVKKPDEVFFLDAPAEYLYNRMLGRERVEYHENIAALKKMRLNYQMLLPAFGSSVKIIDVTTNIGPDFLLKSLRERYFST